MGFFKDIIGKVGGLFGKAKSAAGMDKHRVDQARFKGQQGSLVNMLMKQSSDNSQSLSRGLMEDGISQSMASLGSRLAGATGGSEASKQRMMSRQMGASGRTLASKGGVMDIQERLGSRKLAGDVIKQGQDTDVAKGNEARLAQEGQSQRKMGGMKALGEGAASIAMLMGSDKSLKKNIRPTGKTIGGIPEKEYEYKGSNKRVKGVIAQDVEKKKPELVGKMNGKKAVKYGLLRRS